MSATVARDGINVTADQVGVEIDGNYVMVNWPTSMLLSTEQRKALTGKLHDVLPANLKGHKVSIT